MMQEPDIEHTATEPVIVPGKGDPEENREQEYLVMDDEGGNAFLVPPADVPAQADKTQAE